MARLRETFGLNDAVADSCRSTTHAPVVCNLDIGHTRPSTPLPLGAELTVDPRQKRIGVE